MVGGDRNREDFRWEGYRNKQETDEGAQKQAWGVRWGGGGHRNRKETLDEEGIETDGRR